MATRMFNEGVLGTRAQRLLPAPAGIDVAALLLLGLLMVVGYKVARNEGNGRGLSALNVVAVAVTVAIIVAVKSLVE